MRTYNWVPNEAPPREAICDLLYEMGEIANHTDFFYTLHAIWLAARSPARLTLTTKWLYPDVAIYYGTSWKAVERSIRRTIERIWKRKADTLRLNHMQAKPKPSEFLRVMVSVIELEFPQLKEIQAAPPYPQCACEACEENEKKA